MTPLYWTKWFNKFYDKGIPDSYRDAWENAIPNYELTEK